MPVDIAVTCITPHCRALIVIPASAPHPRLYADANGWRATPGRDNCPACAAGRGPVYEAGGDCPRCYGRARATNHGERCMSCGHDIPLEETDE
ncbi:hypothetical protein [Streptomyces noursei]|uniref:hypothetical protein n=1 Tax=Streptomyces noursei TaxID=1971 RepID=UPI0023B865E5|nr:hypothetical protein [Streptomyces noursei]